MKKTVRINVFDRGSITRAIKMLEKMQKDFTDKVPVFIEKMSEVVSESLKSSYGDSYGITVATDVVENGYVISANGEQVVFIEFGAGDDANETHAFASVMPFDVSPGSWSRSEEGKEMYAKFGYWKFHGIKYTYIEPRNAFEKAYVDVLKNYARIAEEVFG